MLHYLPLVFFVLCGLVGKKQAVPYEDCAVGWFKYNLHCYQVQIGREDWASAQSKCTERSAVLASIHSEQENIVISSQLPKGKSFWIGLSRLEVSAHFAWSSSESVDFTMWAKQEPKKNSNQCTYLQQEGGKWRSTQCDSKTINLVVNGYICKRPLNILLPSSEASLHSKGCQSGGYAYDDTCYTVHRERKSWFEAQRLCEHQKGSLVTISNNVTRTFMKSVFGSQTNKYWIGFVRNETWASWLPEQNLTRITTELHSLSCIAINADFHVWELRHCNDTMEFICETRRQELVEQATDKPQTCPSSWMPRNDFCYKYFSQRKTWIQSQSSCQTLGGNLPSIHDYDIQDYLLELIKKHPPLQPIWIGLRNSPDEKLKNSFHWSDGSPFDYMMWSKGEPNRFTVSENCVEMFNVDGNWNDNNCILVRPYVCAIRRGQPDVASEINTEDAAPECPERDWMYYKGHCYYMSNENKSWTTARDFCRAKGGDLASINSEEENNFVMNLQSQKMIRDIWIGLNKKFRDTYVWSDESPENYLAWFITQPKDVDGSERCVTMKIDHGRWFNSRCFKELPFLCKRLNGSTKPIQAMPTPIYNGTCPEGFFGRDDSNKCFRIGGVDGEPKLTFSRARDVCNEMRGANYAQLASIGSSQEQEIVESLVSIHKTSLWIGFRDADDNTYSWLDGSENVYSNWAQGQPITVYPHTINSGQLSSMSNNSSRKSHHANSPTILKCVQLVSDGKEPRDHGKWKTADCNTKHAYICQALKSLSVATTTMTSRGCTDGRNIENGNVRYLFKDQEQVTWPEADLRCKQCGLRMVTINSNIPFLLIQLQTSLAIHQDDVWIGPVERNDDSMFRSQLSDNSTQYSEKKCVGINRLTGKWVLYDCFDRRLGYICETYT
ncbi:macrophage mannose receptor 1, partial [Biomphalaria pfeifferi]